MTRSPDIILRPPVATAAAGAISPAIAVGTSATSGVAHGSATPGTRTAAGSIRWHFSTRRFAHVSGVVVVYGIASPVPPAQVVGQPVAVVLAAAVAVYVCAERIDTPQ